MLMEKEMGMREKSIGSTLSVEQMQLLRNNCIPSKLNDIEKLKAKCNHIGENNMFSIVGSSNGMVTCTICKETFSIIDFCDGTLEDSINVIKDIIQTTKIYSIFYNDEEKKKLEKMCKKLAVIDKLPQAYKNARDNFYKKEKSMSYL